MVVEIISWVILISLHERYVSWLELTTPGFAVRRAVNCAQGNYSVSIDMHVSYRFRIPARYTRIVSLFIWMLFNVPVNNYVVMSKRPVDLSTLFQCRLRPKRLTIT